MKKVLCVCFGNTCRSPMMEAILHSEFQKLGLEDIGVESAGVNKSSEGQSIAEFSAKELKKRGLNRDRHMSRHIGSIGSLDDFIRIVCVGDKEAEAVGVAFPDVVTRVSVIPIPNPWQLGEEAYRDCAISIEKFMGTLAGNIAAELRH